MRLVNYLSFLDHRQQTINKEIIKKRLLPVHKIQKGKENTEEDKGEDLEAEIESVLASRIIFTLVSRARE